ncbi:MULTISPECIES: hypothetical protein [Sorangium]|uniref:Uncharacterized protein n=1 Tax=Sorangium atrum TaxID=2995308 RepID=A0ABT5BUG9_9BACT|nr:hypothetical protein [Sorangium aterium]MDC0677795.1 hypothetical protein [Sorangium aterium]
MPSATDTVEAARRPERAILSALTHGAGELGGNLAAVVVPNLRDLEETARSTAISG